MRSSTGSWQGYLVKDGHPGEGYLSNACNDQTSISIKQMAVTAVYFVLDNPNKLLKEAL